MYLEYFVLAGGGAGGGPVANQGTGGGGAGGLLIGSGTFPPRADYDCIPGAGGVTHANGGDSAIYYITNWVPGGGCGGSPTAANGYGGNGGSGGGGTGNYGGYSGGAGTAGLGYNGGTALFGGNLNEGGGGGGIAGAGGNGYERPGDQFPIGGPGGAAVVSDFSGVGVWYAGGGGGGGGRFGGGGSGSPVPGNLSGGNGATGSNTPNGTYPGSAGIPYTGGGGGGGSDLQAGANGGSGLIMIRYAVPPAGVTLATGGTIADAAGYRIHTFYTRAIFTIVAPTMSQIVPVNFPQAASTPFTLYGSNFTPGATLRFESGAVSASSFAVVNPTTATGVLNVAPTAPAGLYYFWITTLAGESTAAGGFYVVSSGSGMFLVMP